jgi:hypothetical protein
MTRIQGKRNQQENQLLAQPLSNHGLFVLDVLSSDPGYKQKMDNADSELAGSIKPIYH